MSLNGYVHAADTILNELAALPTEKEARILVQLMSMLQHQLWDEAQPADFDQVEAFLGMTPAKRLKQWQRLDDPSPLVRLRLLLRAMDLAQRSATTLRLCQAVGDVRGMTHRQAAQHAARSSLQASLSPLPERLAGIWP